MNEQIEKVEEQEILQEEAEETGTAVVTETQEVEETEAVAEKPKKKTWIAVVAGVVVVLAVALFFALKGGITGMPPEDLSVVGNWEGVYYYEPITEEVNIITPNVTEITLNNDYTGVFVLADDSYTLDWQYLKTNDDGARHYIGILDDGDTIEFTTATLLDEETLLVKVASLMVGYQK